MFIRLTLVPDDAIFVNAATIVSMRSLPGGDTRIVMAGGNPITVHESAEAVATKLGLTTLPGKD